MAEFMIRKVVGCLLMPAGILGILLLGATVAAWRRRRGAGLLLGLTVLYFLAGNVMLGNWLMTGLERTAPPVDLAGLEPFDAVFVLGGGADQDDLGRPELTSSGDRVQAAARLWYGGKARCLVASGASPLLRDGQPRDGAEATRSLWMALGIPGEAIRVVDRPCWNTKAEIQAYVALRRRMGWRRIALVSSASHLPRVLSLARRYGLEAIPFPADRQGRRDPFQIQNLLPQGRGFQMVQDACWERLGRIVDR